MTPLWIVFVSKTSKAVSSHRSPNFEPRNECYIPEPGFSFGLPEQETTIRASKQAASAGSWYETPRRRLFGMGVSLRAVKALSEEVVQS